MMIGSDLLILAFLLIVTHIGQRLVDGIGRLRVFVMDLRWLSNNISTRFFHSE